MSMTMSMSTMNGVALKREKKKMELEGGIFDAETIQASKYWNIRHNFFYQGLVCIFRNWFPTTFKAEGMWNIF